MNRRVLTIILSLVIVLVSLTACGAPNNEGAQSAGTSVTANDNNEGAQSGGTSEAKSKLTANDKFAPSGMLNIQGEPFLYEEGKVLEHFGFGYALTEEMQRLVESYQLDATQAQPDAMQLFYYDLESIAAEIKAYDDGTKVLTEEEQGALWERVNESTSILAGIFRLREGDESAQQFKTFMEEKFAYKENIGVIGKDTYYFAYNDTFSHVTFGEKDKETLDALLKDITWLRDNICIFPAADRPIGNMLNLDTKTIKGESFGTADLAKYKLTMVNVWASWCPPCVREMPELETLRTKLPEGVNLISICDDVEAEPELVDEIIAQTGIQYPVLIPNDGLKESLMNTVMVLPTTIFVDGEGNAVGDPIEGVPSGDVVEAYLEAINERLQAVN